MPILLFLAWLVFHARLTPDVIILGIIVSGGMLFLMKRVGIYSMKNDFLMLRLIPRVLAYLLDLVRQILLANIHVIYLVLVADEISPTLVYYKSPVKTVAGKVVLSSSITLTPGTLTVDVDGDTFCVHAIDKASAEGLRNDWASAHLKGMEEKIT